MSATTGLAAVLAAGGQPSRGRRGARQAGARGQRSLVALAVLEAVAAAGANSAQYRRQMFDAWHDEHDRYGRLSPEEIVGFGHVAGLQAFGRDAAFARLAAEHAVGAALGVLGTPRLVFGPDQAAFVKLDRVSASGEAEGLWEPVRRLAVGQPPLREWQRPVRPGVS